jgi:zinc ribbon protein
MICPFCTQQLGKGSRFCTRCGSPLPESQAIPSHSPHVEDMNIRVLYVMVTLLLLAVMFPPWEASSAEAPAFLGFHFILKPPASEAGSDGVISRLLLTIELTTIGVGGMYFSWVFRRKT